MKHWIIALCIGYVLDLCFGDPYWMPHPIRLIGNFISFTEKKIRKIMPKNQKGEWIGGIILVCIILLCSTFVSGGILWIAYSVHTYLGIGIESIMCYQLLATKSLKVESMKVYKKLEEKDLIGARKAVSMIVGRDTESLTEKGVAKAAVETIAENTSDGIIAPILYIALGGAALGFFYKATNTMDSMVGYKNDNYLYFGRAAAKFDDIVNYIPARISAYFMILASYLIRLDGKNAFCIFKRDRYNHASPNSAQTEAVCAGALGLQLAGDAYYFGKLYPKKTIGDAKREIEYKDIKRANYLLYMTSFIGIVIVVLIHFLLWICLK